MKRSALCLLAAGALAVIAHSASAATVLNSPVDGLSTYSYYPPNSPANFGSGAASDPILHGLAYYPWYKERNAPIFEFQMNPSLYGQTGLSATFNVFITELGADSAHDGIQFGYYQGNGVLEYHANAGTLLGTVDPMQTGWVSLDASTAIQFAADHGWSWVGFILFPDDWGAGPDAIHVAASEYLGHAPYVAVNGAPEAVSVPIPASLSMGLFGMAGLAYRRFRRH